MTTINELLAEAMEQSKFGKYLKEPKHKTKSRCVHGFKNMRGCPYSYITCQDCEKSKRLAAKNGCLEPEEVV